MLFFYFYQLKYFLIPFIVQFRYLTDFLLSFVRTRHQYLLNSLSCYCHYQQYLSISQISQIIFHSKVFLLPRFFVGLLRSQEFQHLIGFSRFEQLVIAATTVTVTAITTATEEVEFLEKIRLESRSAITVTGQAFDSLNETTVSNRFAAKTKYHYCF